MQMAFPRVAAIVVNYQTPGLTIDCLASLAAERSECPGLVAIVVDNASGDDSIDCLRETIKTHEWETWVYLVDLPENRGFSDGNNAALARAAAIATFDAYLLVNSDTVFRRGALCELSRALAKDERAGLVGPQLEWPNGELQASCFRNLSPTTELLTAAKTRPLTWLFRNQDVLIPDPELSDAIEWISFACVLIRREVFEEIGLLDSGFFMYFEDVDFCRRARSAGWRIVYAPAARVVHLRGGRTPEGFAVEERNRRPAYYYRARARYMAKYYGRTGPWRANLCWLAGRGVSWVRELIGKKPPHTAAREATDIWIGSLRGFARADLEAPTGGSTAPMAARIS